MNKEKSTHLAGSWPRLATLRHSSSNPCSQITSIPAAFNFVAPSHVTKSEGSPTPMIQRRTPADISASAQGANPDVLTEQGSIVVYTSADRKRSSMAGEGSLSWPPKRAEISWEDRALAFASALASACVFPGSSLEYPVDNTIDSESMLASRRGKSSTQPTQNAVGVGSHFLASSKAIKRRRECASVVAGTFALMIIQLAEYRQNFR